MDDLTITRLCARAAGLKVVKVDDPSDTLTRVVDSQDPRGGWYFYRPLDDRGQALELVERLRLDIYHFRAEDGTEMVQVSKAFDQRTDIDQVAPVSDFLRAICLCAARVRQARESQK